MSRFLLAACLVLLLTALLHAEAEPTGGTDTVLLRNGDRLTGAIVKLEDGKLHLRSEHLGEVSIRWEAIERVSSAAPVYVSARDAKPTEAVRVLAGPLRLREAEAEVETADQGRVLLERNSILAIRSEPEHLAHEKELRRLANPSLFDFWATSLDAGASAQHGNAGALTMSLGMRADRTTPRNRFSVHFNSLFAQTRTQEGETQRAANAVRGGLRYEVNVAQRAFTFAFSEFEFDQFRELDLRSVQGGGMGLRLARTERYSLDLLGGGSFNQELFATGESRRSAEALLGSEMDFTMSSRTSLSQRALLYPNLTDTGKYRITFDATAVTRLSDRLSWQLTVANHYVTNPADGARRNDLVTTTGIRINFGERREFKRVSRLPDLMKSRLAPSRALP